MTKTVTNSVLVFNVWMKLKGKQVQFFAETHLQDHLGGPQITPCNDFSHCYCKFFMVRFVWDIIRSQEFHMFCLKCASTITGMQRCQ